MVSHLNAQTTRVGMAAHGGFSWGDTKDILGIPIGELGFDVELIPRKLFAYGSAYLTPSLADRDNARAGVEVGAGIFPIRKTNLYINGGLLLTGAGALPSLGIGAFVPVSERGLLRFRASLVGLSSLSIGYFYTVYQDDKLQSLELSGELRRPSSPPNVIGHASSNYFRKGSDYDLQFVLENLTDEQHADILFDVKVVGPANSLEGYRPVIVSDVVRPKEKTSTEEITVYGLPPTALYFDTTPLGSFSSVSEDVLRSVELLPVKDGEITMSLVNFGYDTEKRDAEFKASITNATRDDLDCIIFRAELLDKNKNTLSTRYFSATEMFPAGETTQSMMYIMFRVGPGVAWMRCTPLRKHVARRAD